MRLLEADYFLMRSAPMWIHKPTAGFPRRDGILDQAENRGMVTRGGNLWDEVHLVNSRVLISKIDVIRGFMGAICLIFVFKVSFSCIWTKPTRKEFYAEITNIWKQIKHFWWAWMWKIEIRTVKVGNSLVYMTKKSRNPTISIFRGASQQAKALKNLQLLLSSSKELCNAINWLILLLLL